MSQGSGIALLVTAAGFAALGLGAPVFGPYWTIVALNLCMWVALTQSWALFSGRTGYISLGNVVFYGIGGYIVVVSFKSWPLWVSVPLAGLAAAAFAAIVAAPVLRVRGPYFVILTFGLAELVKYTVLHFETSIGVSSRLLFGAPKADVLLIWVAALALAATVLAYLVEHSRFGRGLAAIREDETAAETVGVPVTRYKIAAYVLSAFIPGMIGGLMALRSTYFEVLQIFNPTISFTIVAMAIIGGSGDVRGPIFGAGFLLVLSELLWSTAPQLYLILLGLFLIAFVLFAPDGISGLVRSVWRRSP